VNADVVRLRQTALASTLRSLFVLGTPRARKRATPYFLLVPILLLLGSLLFVPEMIAFGYSTTHYTLGEAPTFVGASNYVTLVHDPAFWNSVLVTLIFVLTTVSGQMVLGLAFALLVNREFRGRNILIAVLMSPFAISPAAAAVMWKTLFSTDFGLINFALTGFGYRMSDFPWLTDPVLALPAVIVVEIWMETPFVFLLLYASIRGLPKEPFEAASIDGASSWQKLQYLTLPMIRPAIIVAAVFRAVYSLRSFGQIYILTGGGPDGATDVLSLYLYRQAFRYFDFGLASATAWLMLAMAILLTAELVRRLHRATQEAD